MPQGTLVVCPCYNERIHLRPFLMRLKSCCREDVLFIDDGSTDGSTEILAGETNTNTGGEIRCLSHSSRRGYGAALISGFEHALNEGYDRVVTLDVDLQHRPEDIQRFSTGLDSFDVVLGTRYKGCHRYSDVPQERFLINKYISRMIARLCSVHFSDPFCGFRGYRADFLNRIVLREQSYGICLEILMEIMRTGVTYGEIPVDLIYIDSARIFLDGLDDPLKRLAYYRGVIMNGLVKMEEEKIGIQQ